jgi:hypothetical protein
MEIAEKRATVSPAMLPKHAVVLRTGQLNKRVCFYRAKASSCSHPQGSLENNRFLSADQDPVFGVKLQCPGKYQSFQVSAFSLQIRDGVAVRYLNDILLDDGAGIQVIGDIVAGGADYFHTSLVGLFIRVSANECR